MRSWFNGLSFFSKVATVATVSILSIGVISATAQQYNNTAPASEVLIQDTPIIVVKPVSTTEAIPYTSSNVDDSSLELGLTQTQTKGVDGVLAHTYQVTYTDGVETSRTGPVDTITNPAVNEVIAIGTKVPAPICGNGTYVNSAGNTVCSPYSAPSAPSWCICTM